MWGLDLYVAKFYYPRAVDFVKFGAPAYSIGTHNFRIGRLMVNPPPP
jgi:hypothetical protein